MAYLYAGLGLAMMAGIASMIQVSISIGKQGAYSKPPNDRFLQTRLPSSERTFLTLLRDLPDKTLYSSELCTAIEQSVNSNKIKYSVLLNNETNLFSYSRSEKNSNLTYHSRIKDSCILTNNEHRVLISPSGVNSLDNNYRLYSCFLENTVYCDMEIDR